MHTWLHKIEVFIDRILAPVMAAFLIVVVGELFFTHQFEFYKHYADWFDGFVVLILGTDLWFKYSRVRKLPTFLKKYWLQVIATIPLFVVFRLMEMLRVIEVLQKGEALAHEAFPASQIEKEASVIAHEVANRDVSRTARMINTFRALSRFPHLLNAAPFFEKPTGKHHWHEKKRNAGLKPKV